MSSNEKQLYLLVPPLLLSLTFEWVKVKIESLKYPIISLLFSHVTYLLFLLVAQYDQCPKLNYICSP